MEKNVTSLLERWQTTILNSLIFVSSWQKHNFAGLTTEYGIPIRKISVHPVPDCHPYYRFCAEIIFHSTKGKDLLKIYPKAAHLVRDDPSPSWNSRWPLHPCKIENGVFRTEFCVAVFHSADSSSSAHWCPPRCTVKLMLRYLLLTSRD